MEGCPLGLVHMGDSLLRRKRPPRQKFPGTNFAYPPARKSACPPVRDSNVELRVMFYLKPTGTSRSFKNQNGTMAKVALFTEKFISAEYVC